MSTPGLVIFDCDGVLVDSEPISLRELTRAINAVDVPMSAADVAAAFMGGAMEVVEREVARRRGAPLPPQWLTSYYDACAAAFDVELEAVAGARAAVEAVQQRAIVTCIASQGRVAKMEQTLRVTGLADLFAAERIFSATMVRRPKPAPDLFLHAAARCGHGPERTVVVEDSLLGVRGARAAGMRVVGYVARTRPEDDVLALAAAGAEVIRDLADLPGRLSMR